MKSSEAAGEESADVTTMAGWFKVGAGRGAQHLISAALDLRRNAMDTS